jgi:hypothetical protein
MAEYGITVGISTFIYFFLHEIGFNSEKANKIVLSLFFGMYFILLALRDVSVGVDTVHYVNLFYNISRLSWQEIFVFGHDYLQYENGFIIFIKLLTYFDNVRLFIIITAALIVFPIMYFYIHEAKDALICISFFLISLLFEMFFSGMRQSIAISFGTVAFYFVKKKKIIPFTLVVLLAYTFHTSALLLLLLYPIYHSHITKKWLVFIIPLFCLAYMEKNLLAEYIFLLVGDHYIDGYYYLNGQSGQGALMILFILLSIYSYIFLDEKKADQEDIGLRNLLLLATFLHLFTTINPVFSRMNYFFIIFIPVAISRINANCLLSLVPIAKFANIIMAVFFIFYFFCLKSDSLNVFDYQFFFLLH